MFVNTIMLFPKTKNSIQFTHLSHLSLTLLLNSHSLTYHSPDDGGHDGPRTGAADHSRQQSLRPERLHHAHVVEAQKRAARETVSEV